MTFKQALPSIDRWLNRANMVGLFWIIAAGISHCYLVPYWLRFGGFFLFFITWGAEFLIERRWQIAWTRDKLFYIALLLFFLLAFCHPADYGGRYFVPFLELRYRLLGFGIVGLFGLNRRYSFRSIVDMMAVVSAAVMLFLIVYIGPARLVGSGAQQLFVEARTHYINIHISVDFFMVATLAGMWWTAFHTGGVSRARVVLYVGVALLIGLDLVLTDGRAGAAMGVGLVVFIAVYELWLRHRAIAVAAAVVLIVAGAALVFNHSRMHIYPSEEGRPGFWRAAGELIAEKPLFGYGMSRAQEEFDGVSMKYQTADFTYWWTVAQADPRTVIHPHSQYVQTCLEYGIVGVLLLLMVYLCPVFLCNAALRVPALLFTGFAMGQSLFEPVLTWHLNTIYIVLMLAVLSLPARRSEETD